MEVIGNNIETVSSQSRKVKFLQSRNSINQYPPKSPEVLKAEKIGGILSEIRFIADLLDSYDDKDETKRMLNRLSKLTLKYKKEIK